MNTETNCIVGCNHFSGGEIKHHKDCPHYPDSLSQIYDRQNEMVGKLKEAKLQIHTLTKVLEKKELTDRERKMVEASKQWLIKNFNVADVFREETL